MEDLIILFYNLCHHSRRAQVSTQFEVIIEICYQYHPFKPWRLKKWVYIRCFSGHNYLREFPIQFIDAMCSIGPYVRLNFKAIIPKTLLHTRLDKLHTRTILQLFSFSFSLLHLTMGWMAESVLSHMMPPFISLWTHLGSSLRHDAPIARCHSTHTCLPHLPEVCTFLPCIHTMIMAKTF